MQPPPVAGEPPHPLAPMNQRDGSTASGTPPRPKRLTVAIVMVACSALISVALVVIIMAHMLFYRVELVTDIIPLAVLVPVLGWLAVLMYGLTQGLRWARFATAMTVPLQTPFYVLFLVLLGPMVFSHLHLYDGLTAIRSAAVLLCAVGIPPAVIPPLLLRGPDMTAYFHRDTAAPR